MTPPAGSRIRSLSAETLRADSVEAFKMEEAEDDAEDKPPSASPSSWVDGEAEEVLSAREAAQISR